LNFILDVFRFTATTPEERARKLAVVKEVSGFVAPPPPNPSISTENYMTLSGISNIIIYVNDMYCTVMDSQFSTNEKSLAIILGGLK
jgi:hypothetical protein